MTTGIIHAIMQVLKQDALVHSIKPNRVIVVYQVNTHIMRASYQDAYHLAAETILLVVQRPNK
jgi:hypothetical protein